MTHWAMGMRILGIVLAAGLVVGCEKNEPPEEATVYDPNIDAPPSPLVVNPSPDLLADQATLAPKDSVGTGGPGAGPGAGQDPRIKAVRVNLSKMIDAAKEGKLSSVAGYASAKDADAMKSAMTALAALNEAEQKLLAAVKTHTGKEPPAVLTQMLARGPDGGPFLAHLHEMSIDELALTPVDANTVTVKDGVGAKLTFTKSDDKWVISLSDAEAKVYAALGELAPLQAQAAKELTEGLGSGLISEASLPQAVMDKAETTLAASARLKEAMEAARQAGDSAVKPE